MRKIVFFLILGFAFSFYACDDNNGNGNEDESHLEEFIGVNIELDTISMLDTTRVTAHATGTNLVYYWQTSSNAPLIPIEGVDSVVLFYADPCLNPGKKYVDCTIIADNREETKRDSIILIAN